MEKWENGTGKKWEICPKLFLFSPIFLPFPTHFSPQCIFGKFPQFPKFPHFPPFPPIFPFAPFSFTSASGRLIRLRLTPTPGFKAQATALVQVTMNYGAAGNSHSVTQTLRSASFKPKKVSFCPCVLLHSLSMGRVGPSMRSPRPTPPTDGWTTNAPIHTWFPSSKDELVRTPGPSLSFYGTPPPPLPPPTTPHAPIHPLSPLDSMLPPPPHASGRRQLQTRTQDHGFLPKPPPWRHAKPPRQITTPP